MAASTSHAPKRCSMLFTLGLAEASGGLDSRVIGCGLLAGVEALLPLCFGVVWREVFEPCDPKMCTIKIY